MNNFIRAVVSSDIDTIRSWYNARNLEAPPRSYFPTLGFVVPGVAAGFLYATDTKVCFMEGFITNKDASSESRDWAIKAIAESLTDMAKCQGFHKILVLSTDQGIVARAKEMKFEEKGATQLLSKDI
jgi:hypothetical protein